MKFFLFLCVIGSLTAPVFAVQSESNDTLTTKLLDEREHFIRDVRFEYQFNEELGRAWVKAYINSSTLGTDDLDLSEERIIHVKTLKLDPVTNSIIYADANNDPVVCATVDHVRRKYSTRIRVNETQNRLVTHRKENRTFDLGTHLVTRAYDVWELKVK